MSIASSKSGQTSDQTNLKNFFDADIDFHWVLDNDGTILAINDTVRNRLVSCHK